MRPPPGPAAPPGRVSRRAITIAVAATGAAAAAVLAGIALQHTTAAPTKVLNIATAQQSVIRILSDPVDGYGATSVTNVWCNNGINPTITQGATFSCTATVDGAARQVAVVFQDNNGTYAVDRPR